MCPGRAGAAGQLPDAAGAVWGRPGGGDTLRCVLTFVLGLTHWGFCVLVVGGTLVAAAHKCGLARVIGPQVCADLLFIDHNLVLVCSVWKQRLS
jgi:hypothetical protein